MADYTLEDVKGMTAEKSYTLQDIQAMQSKPVSTRGEGFDKAMSYTGEDQT
ncbi:hypothetical protein GM547_13785, partial [Streptococcus pneumoniae]|nr:hypothetical protein [Streptococcus pneumoniae]